MLLPEKGTDAEEAKPTGVHVRGLVVGPCARGSDTACGTSPQAPLEVKTLQASEICLEDAAEVYWTTMLFP